jgi:uncharacterized OB-fold protein
MYPEELPSECEACGDDIPPPDILCDFCFADRTGIVTDTALEANYKPKPR